MIHTDFVSFGSSTLAGRIPRACFVWGLDY